MGEFLFYNQECCESFECPQDYPLCNIIYVWKFIGKITITYKDKIEKDRKQENLFPHFGKLVG
jgi:hypothetical protein